MRRRRAATVMALLMIASGLAFAAPSWAGVPTPPKFVALSDTMGAMRYGPAAAPTQGKVLIAGGATNVGFGAGASTKLVELFDPAGGGGAGAFAPVSSMLNSTRYFPFAASLPGGKVLIGGGFNEGGTTLGSAEEYDPATGKVTLLTHALNTARDGAVAAPLSNGTVLVAGGIDNTSHYTRTAEIFNPTAGTFTQLSQMMESTRHLAAAAPLPDGRVLIAGGVDSTSHSLRNVEIYDPATGGFAEPPEQMNTPRAGPVASPLPDGKVLIAGGEDTGTTSLRTAEIFDPTAGTFTALPASGSTELQTARRSAAAGLLSNGDVLIAGGTSDSTDALNTAELFESAPEAQAGEMTFGDQAVNTSSTERTVTVTNIGAQPLAIDGFTLGGSNASDFTISSQTCDGTQVPFKGTCTFTVQFDPSATGERTGTLQLSDNEAAPLKISLTGSGVTRQPSGVIQNSAPPNSGEFDVLHCRTTKHTSRVHGHRKVKRQIRCKSSVAKGAVKLGPRSVRATLVHDGFVYGTGKATSPSGKRLELTPRRRLVRGRYRLTLTFKKGHHRHTIHRTVIVS